MRHLMRELAVPQPPFHSLVLQHVLWQLPALLCRQLPEPLHPWQQSIQRVIPLQGPSLEHQLPHWQLPPGQSLLPPGRLSHLMEFPEQLLQPPQ